MKTIVKISYIASIILVINLLIAGTAEAGFFDRAKDIYNIPEQLEGIQQEYDAAKQQLESQLAQQRAQLENQLTEQREQMESQLAEQREQLEQSRMQAEKLLSRQNQLQESNEYYRQQNEQYREQTQMLAAENQNLLLKLEQAEQDRKSIYQKLALVIGTLIALFLLYALSVRIWRFIVWRKQRTERSVLLP